MREIEIKVNGNDIISESDIAGVQGSGGGSFLKLRFAENWENLTKRIIFTNARGLNPVVIVLGTDLLLEDDPTLSNYEVGS